MGSRRWYACSGIPHFLASEAEIRTRDRLTLEIHVDVELVDLTSIQRLKRPGAGQEAGAAGDGFISGRTA